MLRNLKSELTVKAYLRTAPTFLSAHTFCAWFKCHARTGVVIDAINYATKYATKMKAKFSPVTKSSSMNLYYTNEECQ